MHKGYFGLLRSEQYLPLFWMLAWDSYTLEQFLLFAASNTFFCRCLWRTSILHTGTVVLGTEAQTDFHCIPQKTQQYHSLMVSASLSEDLNLQVVEGVLVLSFFPVEMSTSRKKKSAKFDWIWYILLFCRSQGRYNVISLCSSFPPTQNCIYFLILIYMYVSFCKWTV